MALIYGVTAIVAAACVTGRGPSTVRSVSHGAETLGPAPLGVNIPAWDQAYSGTEVEPINHSIRAGGLRLLRYPGGSWADEFDWTHSTDTSKCGSVTSVGCTATDALGFDQFSAQAHAAGASTFVTVNYGSGTPGQAASWVAHAGSSRNTSVAAWEVGNESYSCGEVNQHLATPPTNVQGYVPGGTVCPSTAVMAKSYATNSLPYIKAMRKADPLARIGIPWAFSGAEAGGAAVADAATWNRTVLRADGKDVNFVDAHWYPFDSATRVTAQDLFDSVQRIPAASADLRNTLSRYAPADSYVVGETNISDQKTNFDFEPVSALFAAATSLEWLANGATSVIWWDLNNYGSPTTGDYGLLSSGSPESEPAGQPLPPFYGEELASLLATPFAQVAVLQMKSSSVLGYLSDQGRHRNVLLVNTAATMPTSITPAWFAKGTELATSSYSAISSTRSQPIGHAFHSSSASIALPPESITVLAGIPRG